jgi:glutamate/tyrosine decarboxylase-like PLP-dependent enzyme
MVRLLTFGGMSREDSDVDKSAGETRRARQTPLSMDPATFRTLGHDLVEQLAEFLESLPDRPVTRNESPSAVRAALDLEGSLPDTGTDAGALLTQTATHLFDHSLFNSHPRFFGYITAPASPIGILGEFLAAAVNANVGGWMLSPAATEIESQTIRWIAELIGYPVPCGGLMVSGGNMANMVGFWAARAAKAGWNVREDGVRADAARRLRAYGSAETHTWIQKAADLTGLGTSSVRWIPTDAERRMDLGALRRTIEADLAAGDLPFLVVGTAGSVSTGAVDALPAIAKVCEEYGMWFHVDGAYGGFAAASPEAPADLAGLASADSVAVDPHKWLYAPLEAGCALVRDPEALRGAFSYHPPYYHFEEQATNYVDYGPQNSRGFRALKVWLALRHVGASGYREMITEDIRLSRALTDAVRATPELQWFTQDLSITTFRFVPTDLRAQAGDAAVEQHLDALNRELLDRLQRGGEIFVSNAIVNGRYVLRACIVNFRTSLEDVNAVPEVVVRVGRELDSRLRKK